MAAGIPWCDGECSDDAVRWECSQVAGWTAPDAVPPWGDDTEGAVLRYIATASDVELGELADAAANQLDIGAWQGVQTPNGGWTDGEPWDDRESAWRAVAAAFLARYKAGDRRLDEGMIALAPWDLARELAWRRGWCAGRATTMFKV